MRVGDVLARADSRQRPRRRCVAYESMCSHPNDCGQRGHRVLETRTERWAQTNPEKAHFADRAGRKRFGTAEPLACSDVFRMRFPSARDQEVHIEQMAQELSSRSAFTLSVVIAGAPGAATRTGRPNFPRRSLAPLTEPRCRINRCPSSLISTLSPARRFNAFRSGAGITSCPLVESFELLMNVILTRLTFHRQRDSERFPDRDRARTLASRSMRPVSG